MNKHNSKQWYIITTVIGFEKNIVDSLYDKINAYKFNNLIGDIRLIKSREIKIEYFDKNSPIMPRQMRNTKNITWEIDPETDRYKKITVKEVNKFPGYVFINMEMTDEVWYVIRNTPNITGFVGSSGSGAKPIPISEFELSELFDPEKNKDEIKIIDHNSVKTYYVNNSENDFYNQSVNENSYINDNAISNEENYENNNENKLEDKFENIDHNFQIGNAVEIINGPLKGSEGVIVGFNSINKDVIIEIDFFDRITKVDINQDSIKKKE